MHIQLNKKSIQDFSQALLWISLLIITFVYFSLSFFVMPWVEDFMHTRTVMDFGLLITTLNFYENWGGRYLAYMLIGASGVFTHSIFNIIYWDRVYAIINFALSIISILTFIRAASLHQVSRINAFKYSLLFNAILCVGMPVIFYYFYWSATIVIYTLGISLMLLLFANLLNNSLLKQKGKGWPAYVLIFLLCGTNEIVIIATGIFLITGILLFKMHTGYIPRLWLNVFIVFIPFALLNLLAPGNSARMLDSVSNNAETSTQGLPFLWEIFHFYKINIWYYANAWILNFLFIVSSALIFISVSIPKSSIFKNIKKWHLCLSIFIWVLLILIPTFLPKYYLSLTHERHWNMAYFFFLLGWYINLAILKIVLMNDGHCINLFEKNKILFTIITSILLMANMKFLEATDDLFYKASVMNEFFQERFKTIIASNVYVVTVPSFLSVRTPNTLFDRSFELKHNSNCFANCAYKNFFKKVVVIEKQEYIEGKCTHSECRVMLKALNPLE